MYQQQPLVIWTSIFNRSRPRQNDRDFTDDIFKCIFCNENVWISLKISRKFVPTFRMNNITALVQIMDWHRPGDKHLSEPMMFSLLTYICVTRTQWVNPWSRDSRLPRAPRTVVTPVSRVNRTAQRVPDNAGLVTLNSNKGTDKKLQQLHAFAKQLLFQPDNNWVK